MKRSIIFLLAGFASVIINYQLQAQSELSFEEALAYTLKNNYDIKVARINQKVAENNATKQNNGYLPTVSASGNYGWTFNGGNLETVQGDRNLDPNSSYSWGGGVDVNYTLWDGRGRKYNYLQSQQLKELSALQVRQLIENTILQLSTVYYNASLQQNTVASLREALSISKDRLKRAQYSYEYGQGTQLDILNAQVDLNTDSVNLLNAIQQLSNSIRNVNFIMGAEISNEISLTDEITIDRTLQKADMLQLAKDRNVLIAQLDKNLLSQEYALGSSRAAFLPTISANAGYDYRGSLDPNGAFVTGNTISGPNAGLTLSWNLFNGQLKTQIKNAELNLESLATQKENTARQVEFDLLNAFDAYETALFILDSQQDNVTTARRNFERSQESFKLAQINSVEFRQAQLNLLNAEIQLNQSKIDAKNAELQVLALVGKIAG